MTITPTMLALAGIAQRARLALALGLPPTATIAELAAAVNASQAQAERRWTQTYQRRGWLTVRT